MLELVGDCDNGGTAEDDTASDTEGKTEEVEATVEEEGPGGGLEEVWFWLWLWFWLLFRE